MVRLKSPPFLIFLAVMAVAMGYALYTNHVWEDYYITYRSSKNLATGHGLVFTHGERLHTFTSPLGVLLPALASLMTLNLSDTGALWIFRLMSCAALGGAAVLIYQFTRQQSYAKPAAGLIIAWLALDSKLVDFTINGMETGFLALFLAYTLWAHLVPRETRWRHLGFAWAGLMWTRPDSFIYIGLIALGFWLFNDPTRTGTTRRALLMTCLKAGAVTTVLYGAWLLFAWGYYGTPIPHTITAKSGFGDPRTIAGLAKKIIDLPFLAWTQKSSMEGTFLPAYYILGGWPEYLIQSARAVAAVCSLLWLLPFLRTEARATSFTFFGMHAYLSYYPYFPFPWYLPGTTLMAVVCVGSVLAQGLSASRAWGSLHPGSKRPWQIHASAIVAVALLMAGTAWFFAQSARLFEAQQRLIEDGTRRKIGEWLKENSAAGDAVFMEPLGYIGYFSQLKTYDFPGLSSREVVEHRRNHGQSWARIVNSLKPRWVVLRPSEAQRIDEENYRLLNLDYALVREFSVDDEVAAIDVPGLPYLKFDARFRLFERAKSRPIPLQDESRFGISYTRVDNVEVTMAHAPSTLVRRIPPKATRASVRFGYTEGAYNDPSDRTDGAEFSVGLVIDGVETTIATRTLDPFNNPADRGLQRFDVELPAVAADQARLLLRVYEGRSTGRDWTVWAEPEFR